jgi:hypothetical protein
LIRKTVLVHRRLVHAKNSGQAQNFTPPRNVKISGAAYATNRESNLFAKHYRVGLGRSSEGVYCRDEFKIDNLIGTKSYRYRRQMNQIVPFSSENLSELSHKSIKIGLIPVWHEIWNRVTGARPVLGERQPDIEFLNKQEGGALWTISAN